MKDIIKKIAHWAHAMKHGKPRFSMGDEVIIDCARTKWFPNSSRFTNGDPLFGTVTEVDIKNGEWQYKVRYNPLQGRSIGSSYMWWFRADSLEGSIRTKREKILEELGI